MMKRMAEIYKALGDETRLEIVTMLFGKELCVCDIIDACNKSQPAISHHLKILKYAGILQDRKEGKWVFYRINYEQLKVVQTFIDNVMSHEQDCITCVPCSPNRLL